MAGRGGVARGASPPRSPATHSRAALNSTADSGRVWTQYVAAWLDADLAVPSLDRRQTFALGKTKNGLKITLLDACRPCTVLDSRCNDLSFAKQADRSAPQRKTVARAPAAGFSSEPHAISAALAPALREDEAEILLVLLSTGHLLAIDSLYLGIEAVLGVFPEAADARSRYAVGSSLVAVMREHGYAVIACGSQLGLAVIDIGPPESVGGALPKPVDLPKGCFAIFVAAYPSDDGLLLVGCTGGRLLLYAASVGFKRQVSALSLNLVQSLDISCAPHLATRGSVMPSFFRRQTVAGGTDILVTDAFVLCGDGDTLGMMAAGGAAPGAAGALGVWDVSLDALQGQSGKKSAVCRLRAQAKSLTPVVRVMLVAKGRIGGMWPVLLALDASGEISFWEVQDSKLSLLCNVGARCVWEPVAAMTFVLTGSVYLLISAGSQDALNVGWLDIVALIRSSCRSRAPLAPPIADQTTTCLGPLLSTQQAAAAGTAVVPGGGEVFFISESRIRQYRASNGRSTDLKFQGVPDAWRAQSILGVFPSQMDAAPTHLLLAVFAGPACAVWLVTTAGEVARQLPGAFDAAMLGSSRADARIVWLTCNEGTVMAHIAPAFGGPASGNHVKSILAPGVDRVISGPAYAGQLLLYWGSQLQEGPLHQSGGVTPDAGVPPVAGPVLRNLPLFGPAELVSWRWDCSGEGPWCLAIAAICTVWVLRFTSSGRAQAASQVSLLAWVDLQGCFAGAGRALSLAWLRPPAISAEAMPGVVLLGTPWGVLYWTLVPGQTPSCLVLCEKPQMLAGVLLDRLLLVEVQCKLSVLEGADRMKSAKSLVGPKARVRARLVSLLEAAAVRSSRASSASVSQAVNAVGDSDWRVLPTRLPENLPSETLRNLWPVASCSDAPPQLSHAASSFYRTARSAGDEFRALAAIVSVLQSGGGMSAAARRRAGGSAAEENRAILQVDDAIRNNRIDPARSEMLNCASKLLLDCTAMAGKKNNEIGGLALASCGLAKHDLLPFGMLFAGVLRGVSQLHESSHQLVLPLASDMGSAEMSWPWSWPLRMRAPLSTLLLSQSESLSLAGLSSHEQSGGPPDFSALALTQQGFSAPPAVRRPAQVVQPGEQSVCQLHTATVMQWLGVRSTEMQVRVLQAMLQESGARSSVTKGDGSPLSKTPPCILSNGILVYWRCADGEGATVRDSAGCARFGKLFGTTEWRPLLADEPMEMVDEWGSKLAPNFEIKFEQDGYLRYMTADGAVGEDDRQMLSLVGGGSSGHGLRHLKKARDEAKRGEDGDSDDDEGPMLGWTVEFWVRLSSADVRSEKLLFARPTTHGSISLAPLSLTYIASPPGFCVKSAGKVLLTGAVRVPELVNSEWTHVALRQCLDRRHASGIEVWANDQVVLGPSSEQLPAVPLLAGLQFGDNGVRITEVRVWGVYRSDMELREFQRQPLPTLLSDERKTLKVRMRAAVDPTPGPELADSGFFGLTQLVAPSSRGTRRRAVVGEAPVPAPERIDEDWGQIAKVSDDDPWGGNPWGGDPWGSTPAEFVAPQEFSWPNPSPTLPIDEDDILPIASEIRSADVRSLPSVISQVSRRLASNEKPHPMGTSEKTDCCASCGAIIMPRMKFCKRCGARCPEERGAATSQVPSYGPKAHSSYVTTMLRYDARPGDRELHVESTLGFSVSDIILIGGLEQNIIAAFGSIILNNPLAHGHRAGTKIIKIPPEDAFPQDASPPMIAPTLEHVLPRLVSSDPRAIAVDSKLFAGVHALEHHSYSLAVSNFRSALSIFSQQFLRRSVGGGPLQIPSAIRARTEASAGYVVLGTLLRRCEEIRTAIVKSCNGNHVAGRSAYLQSDPDLLRRLCSCWFCVLRVAKAPCHTVRYAVQAMAVFFTMAKSIGGWLAAEQVASALLGRCREMLTARELEQVEYVAQAASVGRVARGASSGTICACPRCGHPLEPLAPSCGYCFADVVVCFRDLSLCDGRRALFCDVCSSAFSAPKGSDVEWATPQTRHLQTSGGHARHNCFICGVGELKSKSATGYPETMAF